MSILKRFSDIMSSNINALLDKFEDPAKMIDQVLRNLEDDLNKVKAETAGVMADEARAKRQLDECNEEINKMQSYAQRAVKAGNDDDARKFLTRKAQLAEKQTALQRAYEIAADNADKMKQMHNKLAAQINELNSRRDAIKAKVAVAKTQQKTNKMGAATASSGASLGAFARMEEKAQRMMDQADAMTELNKAGQDDDIEDIVSKYDDKSLAVEDELDKLKSQIQGDVEAELANLKEQCSDE
jgi:phage shock protein A